MKITTRAVYDMTDPRFWGDDFEDACIEAESFEYDGAIALCSMHDGAGTGRDKIDIRILPYCFQDGIPTMRDSEIAELFDMMRNQGCLPVVFYDKSVIDSAGFIREMKRRDTHFFVAYTINKTPLAMWWLNTFEGRSARIHFCAFKAAFGISPTIGRECLARTLQMQVDGAYILDCLIGITASSNKLALRALKKAGMIAASTIPNMLYNGYTNKPMDAVLSYCTRKEVCE